MKNKFDAMENNPVPEENRFLTCPHCHNKQHPVPLELRTSLHWEPHKCEHCGRLFAYAQIITRSYVTATVRQLTNADAKEEPHK